MGFYTRDLSRVFLNRNLFGEFFVVVCWCFFFDVTLTKTQAALSVPGIHKTERRHLHLPRSRLTAQSWVGRAQGWPERGLSVAIV